MVNGGKLKVWTILLSETTRGENIPIFWNIPVGEIPLAFHNGGFLVSSCYSKRRTRLLSSGLGRILASAKRSEGMTDHRILFERFGGISVSCTNVLSRLEKC